MRSPNLGSIIYTPNEPPSAPEDMQRYLREEFNRIAAAISLLALGHLDVVYVAPLKPRTGDLRNADGTSWNPGSGAGVYRYNGTTWNFLG